MPIFFIIYDDDVKILNLCKCFIIIILGFIPKSEHYFGKRYAENCGNAISDFENDQRKHNKELQMLKTLDALQSGKMEPHNVDELPVGLNGSYW